MLGVSDFRGRSNSLSTCHSASSLDVLYPNMTFGSQLSTYSSSSEYNSAATWNSLRTPDTPGAAPGGSFRSPGTNSNLDVSMSNLITGSFSVLNDFDQPQLIDQSAASYPTNQGVGCSNANTSMDNDEFPWPLDEEDFSDDNEQGNKDKYQKR